MPFSLYGPKLGIEIGQRALRAAAVRKGAGGWRAEWLGKAEMPAGLLIDSFTEPNITDRDAFVGLLRGLVSDAGNGKRGMSVALPDYLARVSILEFETLPGKKGETEQMLRWRLKKVLPFDVEQATLRHQYLGRYESGESQRHRFLVSIIKTDILSQYEGALNEAGLRPARMDISSFSVWNLFHDHVIREAGESSGFALMNLSGGKLTVVVFDRGVPHFLRLKDLGKRDDGGDVRDLDVMRVLRELNASLTYYKENYAETPVTRVYISGDAGALEEIAAEVRGSSSIEARVLSMDAVVKSPDGKAPPLAYGAACGAAVEL